MSQIMTETEAVCRRCPFTVYTANEIMLRQGEHSYPDVVQAPCMGSSCMAWRWAEKFRETAAQSQRSPFMRVIDALFFDPPVQIEEIPQAERRGYCGAGGEP